MKAPRQLHLQAADIIPARRRGSKTELVVMRLVTANGAFNIPLQAAHAHTLGQALVETAADCAEVNRRKRSAKA
jgi:hypothetical protein